MHTRKTNIEILRIVSMIMIVLSHCVFYGVVDLDQPTAYMLWNEGSFVEKAISSFCVLGTVGVGIFFTISGYFFASKKNVKKIISNTCFYALLSLITAFVIHISNIYSFNANQLYLGVLRLLLVPVTGSVWWFVTAYILLMLVSPVYNEFLIKLNKSGFKVWLGLLAVFGYTLGNLGSHFHDLECAIFFYSLGVYFKQYKEDEMQHKSLYLQLLVVGLLINTICRYFVFSYELVDTTKASLVRTTCSMMAHFLAEPICVYSIFGLFICIRIESKAITKISAHTFGVYLFHESPFIRIVAWQLIFDPGHYYHSSIFIPYVLLAVIVVFSTGIMVDIVREKIFSRWFEKVENRVIETFKKRGYKE